MERQNRHRVMQRRPGTAAMAASNWTSAMRWADPVVIVKPPADHGSVM
jgi:hypothetical protein